MARRGYTRARRNPVRKEGSKWAVIKPDGTVDLRLGDEQVARRLAAACGYDAAAAAASAPAPRARNLRGAKSNPSYRGGAISPLIQQMTDIDLCKAWNSTLDLDFDERREGRHFTYENEIEELEREIDYRADGKDMDDWCSSILRAKSNPYRP